MATIIVITVMTVINVFTVLINIALAGCVIKYANKIIEAAQELEDER